MKPMWPLNVLKAEKSGCVTEAAAGEAGMLNVW